MKIELYPQEQRKNTNTNTNTNNLDSQRGNTWRHFAKTFLWSSSAAPLGLGRSEHGGERKWELKQAHGMRGSLQEPTEAPLVKGCWFPL